MSRGSYTRSGLPVEITAESDNWRRIRDWEGSEGWVYHSLLSGRRTAMVTSKHKDELVPLFGGADEHGPVVARLQPGVSASVRSAPAGSVRSAVPVSTAGSRRSGSGASIRTSWCRSALTQHGNLRRLDDQADRIADVVHGLSTPVRDIDHDRLRARLRMIARDTAQELALRDADGNAATVLRD